MPEAMVMVKPVSGACNMRCRYCFYCDEMARREIPLYPCMSEATLEVLVRRTFAYADGRVSFAFQGGEPTLAGAAFFEAFMRFVRMYNVRGLPVIKAVQTNGLHLSEELIELFAREGFLLGVSLDGIQETHDANRRDSTGAPTFDRALANLNRMRARGVACNVLCVVSSDVARRPRDVYDALAPYEYLQFIACLDRLDGGAGAYSLRAEDYLSFLRETFDRYARDQLRGRKISIRAFDNYVGILLGMSPENCAMCGACVPHFLVEGNGDVYPCDFYALDEWKLGNVNETPLHRLAASPLMREFVERSRRVPERCGECEWYLLCRNGCARERDADGLYIWCDVMRRFFEYSYPRLREIASFKASGRR